MTLTRIEPMSAAIFSGTLYAIIGLIIGGLMTLFTILGVAVGGQDGLQPMMVGIGAVILLPVFYGIAGFIGGIVMAALYNFVASLVGGIRVDFAGPTRGYSE